LPKRILAEARPGDAVLIAAYQLEPTLVEMCGRRDGFLDPLPASRSKAQTPR